MKKYNKKDRLRWAVFITVNTSRYSCK